MIFLSYNLILIDSFRYIFEIENINKFYLLSECSLFPISFHFFKSPKFSNYLAGLIEGDGSIIVPKTHITSYRPYFEIVFAIADLPLCEKIQLIIGGKIKLKKNYCILIIKRKLEVLNIIHLINGNFRTPKIEALNRMITWYNLYYNTNLILLPLDYSPLQSNYWLAGFIEADGSFYFNFKIGKNNFPINLQHYMRISQKLAYNKDVKLFDLSYFSIMNNIATFLNVPLRYINRLRNNDVIERGYEVRSANYLANYTLLSYLLKYPLLGYKYNNIIVQLELLILIKNKEYKNKKGINLLNNLKLQHKGYNVNLDTRLKNHLFHLSINFPYDF